MSLEVPQLDLRKEDGDVWETFSGLFDDTEPGAAFELVAGEPVDKLLEILQRDRAGRFEWWPLEGGPPLWRVLVARRVDDEVPLGLYELFSRDHRRMRALLEQTRDAVESGDRQKAAHAFAEFRHGLERHTRSEETLLFPVFRESQIRDAEKDVDGLLAEHKDISEQLGQVVELFGSEERFDQPGVEAALTRLWKTVQVHEQKEEKILLPLCDRLMSERERSRAILEAQRN